MFVILYQIEIVTGKAKELVNHVFFSSFSLNIKTLQVKERTNTDEERKRKGTMEENGKGKRVEKGERNYGRKSGRKEERKKERNEDRKKTRKGPRESGNK